MRLFADERRGFHVARVRETPPGGMTGSETVSSGPGRRIVVTPEHGLIVAMGHAHVANGVEIIGQRGMARMA